MIEDDIRTALLPAFPGVDVIIAYPNGPRPPGLYVAVRLEQVHKLPPIIGMLSEAPVPPGEFSPRPLDSLRVGSVELQCFGDESYDVLDNAINMLASEACMEAAHALNISFGPANDVQREPSLRNASTWENRAIESVPIAYTRGGDEMLSWIETVNGEVIVDEMAPLPFTATIADN